MAVEKRLVLALAAALALAPVARAQDKPKDGDKGADKPAGKDDAKPPSDADVKKRLESQKVSLNLAQTPLAEAIDTLRDLTGLNFAGPALPDAKVSLKVMDVTLKHAIELILAADADLKFEVWRGTIWIDSKKTPHQAPPAAQFPDELAKKAKTQKITVNFQECPLSEVVDFFKDMAGVKLKLDDKVKKDDKVSLKVKDLPLGAAIDLVCRIAELKVEKVGNETVMKPR